MTLPVKAVQTSSDTVEPIDQRRVFFADVLVLQLKLFVGGWLHFLLAPATLVAAILDLVLKSDRHGSRFYRVLEWGHIAEEKLGIFAALQPFSACAHSEATLGLKDEKGSS